MKRDLSHSDFAGLEHQAQQRKAFRSLVEMGAPEHDAFINSLADNDDEGNIIVGLRWSLIATVLAVLAIGTGLYLGSVVVL